jgi:hypothetical protein
VTIFSFSKTKSPAAARRGANRAAGAAEAPPRFEDERLPRASVYLYLDRVQT